MLILRSAVVGPSCRIRQATAHDMCCAYSILTDADSKLAPFRVPRGVPRSDKVVRMFSAFEEVCGAFTRVNRGQSVARQDITNRTRLDRVFDPGEIVFRRMPRSARMPKHVLPPPSRGPYCVHKQPDRFNLILKDPSTGELVDGGARIPLDQILAGPRRARLQFAAEDESEIRLISRLIEGTRNADGQMQPSGRTAGRRAGWGPLARGDMVAYQTVFEGYRSKELTIGRVLVNDRDQQTVVVQPYEAQWSGIRVVNRLCYQTPFGYTLVPCSAEAKETTRYGALVSQVELLTGGELTHGCARCLSDRGRVLLVKEIQVLRLLQAFKSRRGAGREWVAADGFVVAATARHTGSQRLPDQQCVFPEDCLPALPRTIISGGGRVLEKVSQLSRGKTIEIASAALQYLMFGHRIAFLVLFRGKILLTVGVRAMSLHASIGWDQVHPLGKSNRSWDFTVAKSQREAEEVI